MKKNLLLDLFVTFLIIAISFWMIFTLNLKFLTQSILLFLLPSLYLICRKPKNLKRTAVGTLLIGGFFYFFLVLVGNYNNAWFVPNHALTFPYKILGVIEIDYMIWGILWVLMIIVSYEHFLERERKTTISRNFYWVLLAITTSDLILVLLLLISPRLLKIPYAYFVTCLLSLLPVVYACFKKPKLISKIARVIPFFAVMFFVYEIIGLSINGWSFSGQYIGVISLSSISFPVEEIIFWFIASSLVILIDYELYVDDGK